MKYLLASLTLLVALHCQAQETTTFILVRHAEKATDDPKDPSLSEPGEQRAIALMNLLEKAAITSIYSTPYKRTRSTVLPLAEQLGLEILDYDPSDTNGFVALLKQKHKGGTILISGHSNTTPFLANALLGEQKYEPFDDDDYGNILIVTVSKSVKPSVVHLTY
jgi:broad specificity phosphatase PhoE